MDRGVRNPLNSVRLWGPVPLTVKRILYYLPTTTTLTTGHTTLTVAVPFTNPKGF